MVSGYTILFRESATQHAAHGSFIMLDYNSRYYFLRRTNPGCWCSSSQGIWNSDDCIPWSHFTPRQSRTWGLLEKAEVQWMTAAGGVLHKEYHEREFSKLGGDFQMVQLWVNLPAANKMDTPGYQSITRDNICQIKLDSARIELIAGKISRMDRSRQNSAVRSIWPMWWWMLARG